MAGELMELPIKYILLILVCITAVLTVIPPSYYQYSKADIYSESFNKFVVDYSKSYHPSDIPRRYEIFCANLQKVLEFNSNPEEFVMGLNKFADMTAEEFAAYHRSPIRQRRNLGLQLVGANIGAIPTAVDWRDEGAVTDVMNQGLECVGSWAIAAVSSVEGALVSQGLKSLEDLSVQQLLDCVQGTGDHGCAGGIVDDAFLYMSKYGVTTDLIYPYTGMNQTCNSQAAAQPYTFINSWVDVSAHNSLALITAIAYTPVVSLVEVNSYVWQFYFSGVVNNYCGNNLNHNVLIVGYNQTATVPYYVVKNSWGQDWGESGYIRIAISSNYGVCGIQSLSAYPVLNK